MQNLQERDSTEKHLKAAYSHIRKCSQIDGAAKFGTVIKPAYDALKKANDSTKEATQGRENAYDDIMLQNQHLNNDVKTTFNRTKEYEQGDSGSAMVKNLFSDGKFTTITDLYYDEKPDKAFALVIKIRSLGESHVLYPLAAILETRIAALRQAIDDFAKAESNERNVQAAENISKVALRVQYSTNYLDAVKELGKVKAEMLFPILNAPPPKDKPDKKAP